MIIDILNHIYFLFIEMAPYLLLGLIFVGVLNFLVSKDQIIKHVGKPDFSSIIKAALIGIPLPLCSCGVVPTAIYMKKNGATSAASTSFLISTPQTGIDSILATYGMMGPVFAIYRPFVALIMGIIGGSIVHIFDTKIDNKKNSNNLPRFINLNSFDTKKPKENFFNRIKNSAKYAFVEFLDDISYQFIVGLIIAALIAYFLPTEFIINSGLNSGILGMLLVLLVAIPMYVCATASIPVAITLMMKGFSPGVAFVFLVAGPATNAASLAIIYKTIGKKLTIIYLFSILVLAIVFGLILDWIFTYFNLDVSSVVINHHHHTDQNSFFNYILSLSSIIFFILLVSSIYRKISKKYFTNKKTDTNHETVLNIYGMTCNHCVSNVSNTLRNFKEIEEFRVVLEENKAYIKGNVNLNKVKKAIEEIGYKTD